MSNPIELHIIDAICERLIFDDLSESNFIIEYNIANMKLVNDKCNIFITALNNNPNYSQFENTQNTFLNGTIGLFLYAKVKHGVNNKAREIDALKYKFASQLLRVIETIDLPNYEYEVEDTTLKYKMNLANPRIAYMISDNSGVSEFAINFECIYERL